MKKNVLVKILAGVSAATLMAGTFNASVLNVHAEGESEAADSAVSADAAPTVEAVSAVTSDTSANATSAVEAVPAVTSDTSANATSAVEAVPAVTSDTSADATSAVEAVPVVTSDTSANATSAVEAVPSETPVIPAEEEAEPTVEEDPAVPAPAPRRAPANAPAAPADETGSKALDVDDDFQGMKATVPAISPNPIVVTPDDSLGQFVMTGDMVIEKDADDLTPSTDADAETTNDEAYTVEEGEKYAIRADLDVTPVKNALAICDGVVGSLATLITIDNLDSGFKASFAFANESDGAFFVSDNEEDLRNHYLLGPSDADEARPMIYTIQYDKSTFTKQKVVIVMASTKEGETMNYQTLSDYVKNSPDKLSLLLRGITFNYDKTEADTEDTKQVTVDGSLTGNMDGDLSLVYTEPVYYKHPEGHVSFQWGAAQSADGQDFVQKEAYDEARKDFEERSANGDTSNPPVKDYSVQLTVDVKDVPEPAPVEPEQPDPEPTPDVPEQPDPQPTPQPAPEVEPTPAPALQPEGHVLGASRPAEEPAIEEAPAEPVQQGRILGAERDVQTGDDSAMNLYLTLALAGMAALAALIAADIRRKTVRR